MALPFSPTRRKNQDALRSGFEHDRRRWRREGVRKGAAVETRRANSEHTRFGHRKRGAAIERLSANFTAKIFCFSQFHIEM